MLSYRQGLFKALVGLLVILPQQVQMGQLAMSLALRHRPWIVPQDCLHSGAGFVEALRILP